MKSHLAVRRRGMAVAVIVVVLAVLSLTLLGSVRPVRQETGAALLRVQTLRAFYAAESGVTVVIGGMGAGLELPEPGDSLTLSEQSVEFEAVPDGSGVIVVTGSSGGARRRISLDIE